MKISITRTDTGLQIRLQGDPGSFEWVLETMKPEIPPIVRCGNFMAA